MQCIAMINQVPSLTAEIFCTCASSGAPVQYTQHSLRRSVCGEVTRWAAFESVAWGTSIGLLQQQQKKGTACESVRKVTASAFLPGSSPAHGIRCLLAGTSNIPALSTPVTLMHRGFRQVRLQMSNTVLHMPWQASINDLLSCWKYRESAGDSPTVAALYVQQTEVSSCRLWAVQECRTA